VRTRRAIGLAILLLLVIAAVFAPLISPADPQAQDIISRNLPPWFDGGSWSHPLGTDPLGRDLLSRLIYGTRISLLIGAGSVVLGGAVGVTLGLIAGYGGRAADAIVMRLCDLQMAIPLFVLALAVLAVLGQGLRNVIIVLAVSVWLDYARVVRAQVLAVKKQPFVDAARAMGAKPWQVVVRHLLPAVAAPVIVIATLQVGQMILFESALSFLGLGVSPSTVTWGQIAADGRDYITTAWWISTFSGVAILITVLGVNFIGDALRVGTTRDATKPRGLRALFAGRRPAEVQVSEAAPAYAALGPIDSVSPGPERGDG
jgi:peptide/nickel transport system permease protein